MHFCRVKRWQISGILIAYLKNKKQSVDSAVILLFLKCLRLFCYLLIFDVDNTVDSVKY